jgi:hypothetical protein
LSFPFVFSLSLFIIILRFKKVAKEKTAGERLKKTHEQASDARRARLLIVAATGKVAEALELRSPAATSAADHVRLRTARRELSDLLKRFDERHGLRG